MQGFKTLIRRIAGLWLIAVMVIGIGGTWLTHNPGAHETAGRAVAAVALGVLSTNPEIRAQIEAEAQEQHRRGTPQRSTQTVAQEWEQERREEEQREAIRAAFAD